MAEELTVIPRDELVRARGAASMKINNGLIGVVAGIAVILNGIAVGPVWWLKLMSVIGGGAAIAVGAVVANRGYRARRVIQAKLAAQELPPARLLEK